MNGGRLEHFSRLVLECGGVEIRDDVGEDVEADDVCGAEGGGLGLADGGAGTSVDFFDGEVELCHGF